MVLQTPPIIYTHPVLCQKHYKKFPKISTRSLEKCGVLERVEFDSETLVSTWIEKK